MAPRSSRLLLAVTDTSRKAHFLAPLLLVPDCVALSVSVAKRLATEGPLHNSTRRRLCNVVFLSILEAQHPIQGIYSKAPGRLLARTRSPTELASSASMGLSWAT